MGIFHSLKGVLSSDNSAPHSPENARNSGSLADEIRDLTKEIQLLRESLGGEKLEATLSSNRGRRGGGRGRGRGQERERERERPREESPQAPGSFSNRGQRRGLPKTPPDDAPVGLLVDYLKTRDVLVFEGQDELARNEAFDHLARHIGQHFTHLAPFYERMKRCVASGRGQRIDMDRYSEKERSAAVQLGTLLHRHGMLKDFYYHRSPKKQLRVIPTKDGEIAQFLTGGWLEIYAVWLLNRRLKARMSAAKYQVLQNVKGTLPDGREFEADLMAFIDGQFFWVECKTGQWQDYSARFRGLVKTFGCDRTSAGLLLLRAPDANTRGRATDLLEMTLLALTDLETYFDDFLKIPEAERISSAITEETLAVGAVPPISEEEIPLENAEPAKKLGRVDLSGDGKGDMPRRRRRRRRGSSSSSSSGTLEEALPISSEESESKADPRKEEEEKPARRRQSRSRPSGAEKLESAKPKPKPKAKVEAKVEEKVEPKLTKSAKGVTIAPDLAAMMASGLKPAAPKKASAPKKKVEKKVAPKPTKAAKGVTIAPDLAAMMASGSKSAAPKKASAPKKKVEPKKKAALKKAPGPKKAPEPAPASEEE
jgi:hypothetical protein